MVKKTEETQPDPEAPVSLAGKSDETPAPAGEAQAPAPWETELNTFWQNLLANVSPYVETSIHNFLHSETEALRARLKSLF